jgi:hypothetical protein
MTLHIIGIDKDPDLAQPPRQNSVQAGSIRDDAERLMRHVNPSDQFWTSAGDILIDIVNDQPTIEQAVHTVIAAGGDVEITAHNEPDSITVTLVEPSGLRHVLFDNRKATIADQKAAPAKSAGVSVAA